MRNHPTRDSDPILIYGQAESLLRGKERRKLCNNTYLIKRSFDTIAIRLHNTDIATYHSPTHENAMLIRLDTGGWQSMTTKNRLNVFTPARVHQDRFTWWLQNSNGDDTLYSDGMLIKEMTGEVA